MGAQIVEIAGQKMAVLPIDDYERLVDIAEDKADSVAAANAEKRRERGEEYLPIELVDRLLAGENALRVWRKFRGLTLRQLSQKTGVSIAMLSQIETGHREGGKATWRSLAAALDVSLDDLLLA